MSKKVIAKFFLKVSISLIFLIFVTPVHAEPSLPSCPGEIAKTSPDPLFNNYRKAEFWIDVKNNKAFDRYKLMFKCGANSNEVDAEKTADGKYLYTNLDLTRFSLNPCEFTIETHEIVVKAYTINNQSVEQCVAKYEVKDGDAQCQLTISDTDHPGIPEKDIKIDSNSNLTISGNNLSGSKFGLLIDDNTLKGSHEADFIDNSAFKDIKIPNQFLTPGRHTISLRRPISKIIAMDPKGFTWGPPLCPRVFEVGTPDRKGNIVAPGTSETEIAKICTPQDIKDGKCTSGGGKAIPDCGDATDIRGAAIATAIGCIHTNPAEFTKDIMTWVIGIGGGLAFLMMILGAFQMITSAGNPETLNAGKERITSAVIGLLFIIFAVLLLQIIGVDILKIPGFGR